MGRVVKSIYIIKSIQRGWGWGRRNREKKNSCGLDVERNFKEPLSKVLRGRWGYKRSK